jgi:protein-tyrosine phosphatase
LIDIHSHVLFGVDDGAKTMDDSVAMARMAAAHGTADLVATPHASPEFAFQPEVNRERLAALQTVVGDALRLHLGCDFHLSFDNIQDAIANPTKYTIGHGRYLMVEFSDLLIFHNTGEIFARLQEAGMIPVITHPERNDLLRQRIDKLAEWVDGGTRIQITAQSLTGRFGKRAAAFSRELLDRNLVHVIASDGHDLEHRPPRMDEARAWLAEHYSEATAELLTNTNPGAALTGEPMLAPAGDARQMQGGWRKWLRTFSS